MGRKQQGGCAGEDRDGLREEPRAPLGGAPPKDGTEGEDGDQPEAGPPPEAQASDREEQQARGDRAHEGAHDLLRDVRTEKRHEREEEDSGHRWVGDVDGESARLNANHPDIYPLSLHDALPIWRPRPRGRSRSAAGRPYRKAPRTGGGRQRASVGRGRRWGERAAERQPPRHLPSFPTRRSSDLEAAPTRALTICCGTSVPKSATNGRRKTAGIGG